MAYIGYRWPVQTLLTFSEPIWLTLSAGRHSLTLWQMSFFRLIAFLLFYSYMFFLSLCSLKQLWKMVRSRWRFQAKKKKIVIFNDTCVTCQLHSSQARILRVGGFVCVLFTYYPAATAAYLVINCYGNMLFCVINSIHTSYVSLICLRVVQGCLNRNIQHCCIHSDRVPLLIIGKSSLGCWIWTRSETKESKTTAKDLWQNVRSCLRNAAGEIMNNWLHLLSWHMTVKPDSFVSIAC